MPKYKIIYMSGETAEVNDPVLTLVNVEPNPLPDPPEEWTAYMHNGMTVLEIWTMERDAALVIQPPPDTRLTDQNVKAKLGTAPGERTTSTWRAAGNGMRVDLTGQAASTDFFVTDNGQPPQALRVVVKRPNLQSPT